MAATLTKASEVNELAVSEGVKLLEGEKFPAALKSAAISATEGNEIEWGNWDRALLLVEHTTAAEKSIKVQGGESPPSLRKGLGELEVKMAEKCLYVLDLESARFLSKEGRVVIKWTASTTGKVAVVFLKKG